MKRLFYICLTLVALLLPQWTFAQKAYDRILSGANRVTYNKHGDNQFLYNDHSKAGRGNGLLGSGGMNYRYSKQYGRYGNRKSMRKNLYGAWCDGSYSGMFNTVPMANLLPGGYSFSAGLCYEYEHYGQFQFQIGLGLRYQSVGNFVDNVYLQNDNAYDAKGYRYSLIHYFYDRCDYSQVVYAQLPILVGSHIRDFYYLVGVKPQVAFWSQTQVTLRGTTAGVYEQYLGLNWQDIFCMEDPHAVLPDNVFVEMDNHGLRLNVPEMRTGDGLKIKPDVMLSGEIGYEWAVRDDYTNTGFGHSKIYDTRVRVALFGDWGMINQNQKTQNPLYYIPGNSQWDFPSYEFNHIFSIEQTMPNKHIHNFFAGIKLTVLVGFPREQTCVLCGPFHSEREYK